MVSLLTEGFLSFKASSNSSWKPVTEVCVEEGRGRRGGGEGEGGDVRRGWEERRGRKEGR